MDNVSKHASWIVFYTLDNVSFSDPAECWWWHGKLTRSGYPAIWLPAEKFGRPLHRPLYILVRGPIPEGFHIDHACGQRTCVNPAHLEAVTPRENRRRYVEGHEHEVDAELVERVWTRLSNQLAVEKRYPHIAEIGQQARMRADQRKREVANSTDMAYESEPSFHEKERQQLLDDLYVEKADVHALKNERRRGRR